MSDFNFQNQKIEGVRQQLSYPLDYVTQEVLAQFLKSAYPVGSVYTAVVSTDPSTLFGFGTWSAFGSGRCLVGVDTGQTEFDTVEETGGEKTHTLTIAEMPAHDHDIYAGNSGSGSPSLAIAGSNTTPSADYISDRGGGNAHNNLQPYITVYFWKRTA